MNEEKISSADGKNAEPAVAGTSRYVAATSISLIGLLAGLVYDMPGSLETVIEKTFSIEPYQFEYLYAAFSVPNIFMGFIYGILLDRVLGLKVGSLSGTVIALLSQTMITAGALCRLYWVMVLGRFLLGIGMETMIVAVQCLCVVWFNSGKDLRIVFGLLQSLTKAGTPIVYMMEPPIYLSLEKTVSNQYVLGISLLPCLITVFFLVVGTFFLGEFSERHGLDVRPKDEKLRSTNSLKEVLNFPLAVWTVIIMLSLTNCAFSSFISCSQQLLSTKFKVSYTEANDLTSLFIVCGLVLTPLTGFITDRLGTDVCINTLGLLVGTASQAILAWTDWTPYISLSLYAVNFSTFNTCAWPLVSYVVKDYQLATAYGITASLVCLTSAVSNLFSGYLLGHYGPTQTVWFLISLLVFSLVLSATIWILDSTGAGLLNNNTNDKATADQKQEAA